MDADAVSPPIQAPLYETVGCGSFGPVIVCVESVVAPVVSELVSAIGLSYQPGPMICLPSGSYALTYRLVVAGAFTAGSSHLR